MFGELLSRYEAHGAHLFGIFAYLELFDENHKS